MGNQSANGKAFEWAVASALAAASGARIEDDAAAATARRRFDEQPDDVRTQMSRAAAASTSHILQIERPAPGVNLTKISIATDSNGQTGDVRDVVATDSNGRVFGISCKTNHGAFKSSRLSADIDFIKQWGVSPDGCSDDYWSAVNPIFSALARLRDISKASGKPATWKGLGEATPTRVYWPLLDAFEKEIRHFTQDNPKGTSALFDYIVGNHDFYKVVNRPSISAVHVLAFNMNKTLAPSVPKTTRPNVLNGVDRSNGSQYSKTVRFKGGYSFNFRIHSAESLVLPSLKFDVQAVGLPPDKVYTNHILLRD